MFQVISCGSGKLPSSEALAPFSGRKLGRAQSGEVEALYFPPLEGTDFSCTTRDFS